MQQCRGGRWSFLPAVVAALSLMVLSGCQHDPRRYEYVASDLGYAATSDSLGVSGFLDLSVQRQVQRTEEAGTWRRRADHAASLAVELRALRTSLGLDPTQADLWLRLAKRSRWFGNYQHTEDALLGLRAALPFVNERRHDLAAAAAVCGSWLRYDRGEWKRGSALVDSARVHSADKDETQLLEALHLAGLGRNRRAEETAFRFAKSDHRAHWIYAVSYWRRGGPEPAHGIFNGTSSTIVSADADFVKGVMRPMSVHVAESYRDFGLVEELLGNWWLAERQYEHALDAVPGADDPAIARVDHTILRRTRRDNTMPVWLAFGRHYVTGSLSAYTAFALDRHGDATDTASREFWASAVLDAAGSCVRLDIDAAWARRARGLVLAHYQEQETQARHDLVAATRWFDRRRIVDVESLAVLGRLFLEAGRPAHARPVLERATNAAPGRARVWSDLGLAYIQLGLPDRALPALEHALNGDPTLAVAWYNRGLLRFHMDDLEGAVEDLNRACELAPGNKDISALLERLRRRLGRE